MTSDELDAAVEDCVAAIAEVIGTDMKTAWPDALKRLANVLGADACAFSPLAPPTWRRPTLVSTGFEEAQRAYLFGGWNRGSPRQARALKRLQDGEIVFEQDVVDDVTRGQSPFYWDFAAPFGLDWLLAIPVRSARQEWTLHLFRSAAAGPFDKNDLPLFEAARARLARIVDALDLALGSQLRAIMRSYDLEGKSAVVLDLNAHVLAHNKRLESLCKGTIRVVNERLVLPDSRDTRLLEEAVAKVANGGPQDGYHALRIACDGAAYAIELYSSRTVIPGALFSAGALGLITPLDNVRHVSGDRLQSIFQLSDAEARIAGALAGGATIDQIADDIHRARETVRSHSRRIFAKMGVTRQAELVALASPFKRVRAGASERTDANGGVPSQDPDRRA